MTLLPLLVLACLPAPVMDDEGYLVLPPAQAVQLSDTEWATFEEVCGEWAPILEWDQRYEGELVNEPVVWPPEKQAQWEASCVERHEQDIYYEGEVCL